MKPQEFISKLDEARLLKAVEDAEKKSSGEVRVFISHKKIQDPLSAAQKHFEKLGMTRTKARNGVLIFIAPLTHKFAIIGDTGIHEKCGDEFWKRLSAGMMERLKRAEWTEALVEAIERVGETLGQHFPREPGDINELPNRIERD
jgi:uncharacterized membrane protein